MKFGSMNRQQRRALARSGKIVDVRVKDDSPLLTSPSVLVVSSPVGDAETFTSDETAPEAVARNAESIVDQLLKPFPDPRWATLKRPTRVELLAALTRVEAGACWITYVAFDGPGNMRMRQERRTRLVLS